MEAEGLGREEGVKVLFAVGAGVRVPTPADGDPTGEAVASDDADPDREGLPELEDEAAADADAEGHASAEGVPVAFAEGAGVRVP
jgi:hypothetical protein